MSPFLKRLCYFANVRFPSERANSIQIVSMCGAFAAVAEEVELLYPLRYNPYAGGSHSIYEHYGVEQSFSARRLFSVDFIDLVPRRCQPPAFRLQSFTFGVRAMLAMLRRPGTVFYIRDNATLALAAALLPASMRKKVFYEAHDFPERDRSARALSRAAQRCGGVVAITRSLGTRFEEAGLGPSRLLIAPDGVDLERFSKRQAKPEAREQLSLPRDQRLVVYTGQLFEWKGVETLVRAAPLMDKCCVVIVGGCSEDRRRLEEVAKLAGAGEKVLFREHVRPTQVPAYLSAADLLVLPNSGSCPISTLYTSPMKLFEYMAARRPVVASDLPSLREVLKHKETALLVPPDDPTAMAAAVNRILTDDELSDKLVQAAFAKVRGFEWKERGTAVWDFMGGILNGQEQQ